MLYLPCALREISLVDGRDDVAVLALPALVQHAHVQQVHLGRYARHRFRGERQAISGARHDARDVRAMAVEIVGGVFVGDEVLFVNDALAQAQQSAIEVLVCRNAAVQNRDADAVAFIERPLGDQQAGKRIAERGHVFPGGHRCRKVAVRRYVLHIGIDGQTVQFPSSNPHRAGPFPTAFPVLHNYVGSIFIGQHREIGRNPDRTSSVFALSLGLDDGGEGKRHPQCPKHLEYHSCLD